MINRGSEDLRVTGLEEGKSLSSPVFVRQREYPNAETWFSKVVQDSKVAQDSKVIQDSKEIQDSTGNPKHRQ